MNTVGFIIMMGITIYLLNMIFVAIFEGCILDLGYNKKLDNFTNIFRRMLIPFYSLFSYPYLTYNFINKKKEKKVKKAKQKYKDIMQDLININVSKFSGWSNHKDSTSYKIHKLILSILENYRFILMNENTFLETAYNRVNYLTTFMSEYNKADMLDNMDILEEVYKMCRVTDELLEEISKNVKDIERKANAELKEYLKSKTKEFIDSSDMMLKDFKKFNK